ncbi:MAG: hypothetical protein DMG31_03520 [Acidobacteria bacterium]|nr:MAG: hypothetical protein DMG31_03520 [Acidobacteriota bacterium]
MNANVKSIVLVTIVLSLIACLPLLAHHGNAAYEVKTVTLKGTVTAWLWTNPHVLLKLDVKDDGGNIVHWVGELVAPSNMINFGFTAGTLKPGDEITIVTSDVARSGAPIARLAQIVLPNGQIMKTAGKYDGNAFARRDHEANAVK